MSNFIAIEGLDGVGKTSVATELASELGWNVNLVSKHGTPEWAKNDLTAHFNYYLELNKSSAICAEGASIVADSHVLRTITSHLALGMPAEAVGQAGKTIQSIPRPNNTFLLYCEPETRRLRLNKRTDNDHYEIWDNDESVMNLYLQWADRLSYKLDMLNTYGCVEAVVQGIMSTLNAQANSFSIRQRIKTEANLHFRYYADALELRSSVLDIGAGTGMTSSIIKNKRQDLSVKGVDIKEYPQDINCKVDIKLYDGNVLPLNKNAVDTALLFYVLHHAKRPNNLLMEAKRVSRGNIIVIEESPIGDNDSDEEILIERNILNAIGLSDCPEHTERSNLQYEKMFGDVGLKIKRKTRLPTSTPRKIQKTLYILSK